LPVREFFTGIEGSCPLLRRGARLIVVWSGPALYLLSIMFWVLGGRCTARVRYVGRSHPDKAAEILNRRHQKELFGGSGEAAQFQAREAKVPLHMPEQHLDLSAQYA
jgi:hypothetical protein